MRSSSARARRAAARPSIWNGEAKIDRDVFARLLGDAVHDVEAVPDLDLLLLDLRMPEIDGLAVQIPRMFVIRRQRRALRTGHGQDAELAGFCVRQCRTQRDRQDRDVTSDHRDDRGAGALVGHMQQLDPGQLVEGLHAQVRRAPVARGGISQVTRTGLGVGDPFGHLGVAVGQTTRKRSARMARHVAAR